MQMLLISMEQWVQSIFFFWIKSLDEKIQSIYQQIAISKGIEYQKIRKEE